MNPFSTKGRNGGPESLIIDSAQFAELARGLTQRAELLDALVEDLTGARTTIRSGLLPPEVLAAANLLPHARAGTVTGTASPTWMAVDVVRNADQSWTALTSHTDTPLGLGLMSEIASPGNRAVEALTAAGVGMAGRVAAHFPDAKIVVLHDPHALPDDDLFEHKPGTHWDPESNSAALEGGTDEELHQRRHAAAVAEEARLIARMLGARSVTPRHLKVSGNGLYDLDGSRVDAVVRLVPAERLDPLETALNPQGVAGLARLARAGSVAVLNPPAAVVASNPALSSFLPRLGRALLREDLALPSVTTYWCGDRLTCSHVIAHASRLIIRSSVRGRIHDGRIMSIRQIADMCAQIADEPWAWVGQEPVQPEEVPDAAGTARPAMVRAFATAGPAGWSVLPGGLGWVGELDDHMRPFTELRVEEER